MRRALGKGAQFELRTPRELTNAFLNEGNRIAVAPFILPPSMSGNHPPQMDRLAIDSGAVLCHSGRRRRLRQGIPA
jgi:hypothetical protein